MQRSSAYHSLPKNSPRLPVGKYFDRDTLMQRINLTRELLDSIRKAGPDGKHREIADTQKVLDGNLDPFIEASLKQGL